MKEKGGEVPSEASEELPNMKKTLWQRFCDLLSRPTYGGLPYSFAVLVFILGIIIGVFL
jgi:hypothetical protein